MAKRLKVTCDKAPKAGNRETIDRLMEITGLSRPSAHRHRTDPNLGVRNVFKMDRRLKTDKVFQGLTQGFGEVVEDDENVLW